MAVEREDLHNGHRLFGLLRRSAKRIGEKGGDS